MPATSASASAPEVPLESDRQVDLSAGPIRYRDVGSGDPIVFVHGALVDGTLWAQTAARLAPRFRCILPDLPLGSHRAPMRTDADLSPPGLARLIADLLEALELERVTLVGNDTGGALSQLVATRHPERLGRLVLTNCDAFENFPPKAFKYLGLLPKVPGATWLTTQSLRLELNRRSPLAYGKLTRRRLDSETLERWVRPSIEDAGVRRDLKKVLAGVSPDYTLEAAERLRRFDRPTLLAWAAEDRFFPIEHAERLAKIIPDARVERIEDALTFVALDQPERLADAISDFVRATD